MQTLVHSDAEAISTDFFSKKRRNISGNSSAESNWVGYPVEENTKGKSHESFDVSGGILIFLDKGITVGDYWVINMELLGE